MSGQIQAWIDDIDPLTWDFEVFGHKGGVIFACGDETVDFPTVRTDSCQTFSAVRFGQRFQENVVALQHTYHRYPEPALHFRDHAREQSVCKIDDLGTDF